MTLPSGVAAMEEWWAGTRLGSELRTFLLIGAGGFLGANFRFLVASWVADRLGPGFPYGTFLINVTGSFAIGLLLTVIGERFVQTTSARLFFAVGFLGAYTTFSAFTIESLALLQSRAYLLAATNLAGSVILGMLAVAAGVVVGRLIP